MFICRRQLLRVHFRKFSPCYFDVRRISSHANWAIPSFDSTEQEDCAQRRTPSLPSPRAFELQDQTAPPDILQPVLDHLDQLSRDTDVGTLEWMIRVANQHVFEADCQPLIQRLHPLLLEHLRRLHVPAGTKSLTYNPPSLIRHAFNFAYKLVVSSRGQLALELLHTLFDQGFIPTEAIKNCDDIHTSVSAALTRASLYWGWRGTATKILLHLLRYSRTSNEQFVSELAVDTSYALLVTPNKRSIRYCLSLFLQMHHLDVIPPGIVRQFYDSASEHYLGEEIMTFYSFTRSGVVGERQRYPPPQDKALTWLMRYLSMDSKRMYLSRTLVEEVVAENLPIIAQYRARFITFAAARGYSSLARQLWNRYSTGKDYHLIIGNSSLMLRMTGLYAHLIRRTNSQLQAAEADDEKDALNRQVNDLVSFRDHVFSSYKQYYTPLEDAPHMVVTSYARACFIVGETAAGFEALQLTFSRNEIPDIYDINVALTAIAQRDPRSAILLINQLKKRGLRPDAVSYTTVMHFARLRGHSELASDMMDELCRLDKDQMNLKSIAALIRATVAFEDEETKELQQQKLQDAMDILLRLTSNGFLPSPQTGKYLVISSLRADDPTMAFRFWKLLLRETVEWEDHEHVFQRRLICSKIYSHREVGIIKIRKAHRMLKQIKGQPGMFDDIVGSQASRHDVKDSTPARDSQ